MKSGESQGAKKPVGVIYNPIETNQYPLVSGGTYASVIETSIVPVKIVLQDMCKILCKILQAL